MGRISADAPSFVVAAASVEVDQQPLWKFFRLLKEVRPLTTFVGHHCQVDGSWQILAKMEEARNAKF